jgi:RNA polymerase sigma-70 factor (ECF subfamily)
MAVPAPPSDEELAARAAAGDGPAFEDLVRRHQNHVYVLAHRLTGDEADAADVLQETFLLVHRRLSTFRGEARFATWLYRIATNAARMHHRARRRRPAESLDEYLPRFDADGRHTAMPEALRVPCHAEERLDRRILAEKARAGIERLPDGHREAFVLRDLEELDTAEVADILGIEPAAVRQRVHRARLMLRGFLSEEMGAKT